MRGQLNNFSLVSEVNWIKVVSARMTNHYFHLLSLFIVQSRKFQALYASKSTYYKKIACCAIENLRFPEREGDLNISVAKSGFRLAGKPDILILQYYVVSMSGLSLFLDVFQVVSKWQNIQDSESSF